MYIGKRRSLPTEGVESHGPWRCHDCCGAGTAVQYAKINISADDEVDEVPIVYRDYLEDFKNADIVMRNGFLLGAHHGMTIEDVDYVCNKIKEYFSN